MPTTVYLYNRTPNSSIEFKTPDFLKCEELPNINNIKIFGSLTYYNEPSLFTRKLDPKAIPYYLVGFIGANIYKLYYPSTNKLMNARDWKVLKGYYYKPNNSSYIESVFTRLEPNNIIESSTSKPSKS